MLPRALLLAFVTCSLAAPLRSESVTVMTQNLYVGFDVEAFGASLIADPGNILTLTDAAWNDVQAADFPSRATAIARQIEVAQPAVIGLQEVSLFRSAPFDGFGAPHATHIELDYLAILLDALDGRGLHYEAVTMVQNGDAEFPRIAGVDANNQPIYQDIRLTDFDVVLARTDLPPGEFAISNPQSGNFAARAVILGTPLPRGWASVDVQSGDLAFRFLTTHLDTDAALQVAQGAELVGPGGPVDTPLPVVMAGDFNSRADGLGTTTYANLLAAGFADAWNELHPGDPGYTWGQDADLRNDPSNLRERLDLVLYRGELFLESVEIVGEALTDRTTTGLWPSDHAGVSATFALVPEPSAVFYAATALAVFHARHIRRRRRN